MIHFLLKLTSGITNLKFLKIKIEEENIFLKVQKVLFGVVFILGVGKQTMWLMFSYARSNE